MANKKSILFLGFLLLSTPAYSFVKLEIGAAHWNLSADGTWRHDRYHHDYDLWSPAYGLGLGVRRSNWIVETTLRRLTSGSIYSHFGGSDADYRAGVQAWRWHGVSTWEHTGVHIEAARKFHNWYAKGGWFFFNHEWQTLNGRLPGSPSYPYRIDRNSSTPTVGVGIESQSGWYTEINYFHDLNLNGHGTGVDSATIIGIGLRY